MSGQSDRSAYARGRAGHSPVAPRTSVGAGGEEGDGTGSTERKVQRKKGTKAHKGENQKEEVQVGGREHSQIRSNINKNYYIYFIYLCMYILMMPYRKWVELLIKYIQQHSSVCVPLPGKMTVESLVFKKI